LKHVRREPDAVLLVQVPGDLLGISGNGLHLADERRQILQERPRIGQPAPFHDLAGMEIGREVRLDLVMDHGDANNRRCAAGTQMREGDLEGIAAVADVVD